MLDCMKEKISLTQFEDSFSALQGKMDGRIVVDDYHTSITAPANELRLAEPLGEGFQLVDIRRSGLAAVAGRVLLLPNRSAFSPAIVTEDAHGTYQITLLDQEYDTKVGFTEGVHFGLSAKAQTQVRGFGGHGNAGGFEAGHFSTVLSGAQSEAIASALVASGGMGGPGSRQQAAVAVDTSDITATVGWDVLAYGIGGALLIAIIGSAAAATIISKVRPAEVMRAE